MNKPKAKNSGQQAELNRALNVTPADLAANDEGIIPPEQRERIIKRQRYDWSFLMGIGATLGGLFLLIALAAFSDGGMTNANEVLGLLTISLLLGGGFLSIGLAQRWQLGRTLSNGEIRTTQGIAVTDEEKKRLEINGLSLKLSKDALRRIKNMEPYRVHYLPGSDVVLSMEMLETDSNLRGAEGRLRDAHTDDTPDTIYDDDVAARQQYGS